MQVKNAVLYFVVTLVQFYVNSGPDIFVNSQSFLKQQQLMFTADDLPQSLTQILHSPLRCLWWWDTRLGSQPPAWLVTDPGPAHPLCRLENVEKEYITLIIRSFSRAFNNHVTFYLLDLFIFNSAVESIFSWSWLISTSGTSDWPCVTPQ